MEEGNKLPKGWFMTVGKEIDYYIKPANQDSVSLQWKTTPPTVEGWYWRDDRDYGVVIAYLYQGVKGEGICENVLGFDLLVSESSHCWLGPLPEPELPTE